MSMTRRDFVALADWAGRANLAPAQLDSLVICLAHCAADFRPGRFLAAVEKRAGEAHDLINLDSGSEL